MRRQAKQVVLAATALLPRRIVEKATRLLLTSQGFGWGYGGLSREVDCISALFQANSLPQPQLILDVGANIGDWTHEALRIWPETRAIVIEPSPDGSRSLGARFADDERVSVVPVALGAEDGEGILYSDTPGSSHASLSASRYRFIGVSDPAQVKVPVWRLDSLIGHLGIPVPDLVKLDVEGLEMDVLLGTRRVLGGISGIQFEWGEASRGAPYHFADLWNFFTDHGFFIYRIAPRGPIPIPIYSGLDEAMTWTNYVAVRHRSDLVAEPRLGE